MPSDCNRVCRQPQICSDHNFPPKFQQRSQQQHKTFEQNYYVLEAKWEKILEVDFWKLKFVHRELHLSLKPVIWLHVYDGNWVNSKTEQKPMQCKAYCRFERRKLCWDVLNLPWPRRLRFIRGPVCKTCSVSSTCVTPSPVLTLHPGLCDLVKCHWTDNYLNIMCLENSAERENIKSISVRAEKSMNFFNHYPWLQSLSDWKRSSTCF